MKRNEWGRVLEMAVIFTAQIWKPNGDIDIPSTVVQLVLNAQAIQRARTIMKTVDGWEDLDATAIRELLKKMEPDPESESED